MRKLNHRQPELILIGNSMLGEGSVVKNIIPQLKKKPALIGIVFRDNHLPLPAMRVTGKHKPLLDSLAGENEELLDRLAYLSQDFFQPATEEIYSSFQ